MPLLQPTFSIQIGSLTSTSVNAVGGPVWMEIDRRMDTPVDALRMGWMTRSDMALDDLVTIQLGHDDTNETVFVGQVAMVRPTLAGFELYALGKLRALVQARRAAVYDHQTVGQIVTDCIQQAGLTAGSVSSGPTLPRYAIDYRLSLYGHLRQLANRLGYELYGDRQGQVMCQPLGAAANLDAGALGAVAGGLSAIAGGGSEGYRFGQQVLQATGMHRLASGGVQVGGESPMSRQGDTKAHWLTTKDTDLLGTSGSGASTRLILDPAARTKDLADRFAAGYRATGDRALHQVRLWVLGRPQVDLGDPINLADHPDAALNGEGYLRGVRHRFNSTVGFVTELTVALGGAS